MKESQQNLKDSIQDLVKSSDNTDMRAAFEKALEVEEIPEVEQDWISELLDWVRRNDIVVINWDSWRRLQNLGVRVLVPNYRAISGYYFVCREEFLAFIYSKIPHATMIISSLAWTEKDDFEEMKVYF